ncbi:6-bladed beta-propeller [Parabacteroides pacaensis]|uniref:6-bladed beta-propeller n=1 Tax=Parabacteroides pacaensis TaxID=2086575 RepID=UPI000D0EFFB3|nr:6-bladed beta-propeller [Parabacteroides pacaensis]
MKKELIITTLCVFLILFSNFKGNAQNSGIDSKGVKTITLSSIKESFQDTVYFKEPQAIVLETTEESLMTSIRRIFTDDNRLFIYDRQLHNIFIFDITGKYISKIDSKGQGPGEYSQICDFTIDPIKKHIILLCDIPEKRMYFTYDGTFIKEESLPDFYLKLTTDGNYIYFEKGTLKIEDYQLHILNTKTGEKRERLESLNIKNFYYANGNLFSRGKNILFVRRYDNSIYELKNGEVIKKYQVDFKEHSVPDWLTKEEKTEVVAQECRKHDYIFSMTNVVDTDNYMMFYTNRGICLYDKTANILTGYKQMINSTWNPLFNDLFTFYFPLENTNKIVCSIDEPSYIKKIADLIIAQPDKIEAKKFKKEHPKLVEEIIHIGSKMTEDNNPVLFIYEFKK